MHVWRAGFLSQTQRAQRTIAKKETLSRSQQPDPNKED
jgi:hypothetical protein